MTQSKGERLVKELIEKYGNLTIGQTYDYYATMILTDANHPRPEKTPEDVVLKDIHLSDLPGVTSWDEYKELEAFCKGKRKVRMIPVKVAESEKEFNSPQQELLRKKKHQEFASLFPNYLRAPGLAGHIASFEQFDRFMNNSPSPKEYGRYLSNKKHR